MKYFKIIILFSFLLFFSSCENFFEQTTEFEIPPHPPKLSVTALWIGEGNDMLVTVFSSVEALERERSAGVPNATVILSENGQDIATFMEDSVGYYHPSSAINLVAGNTYELKVSAENFETVKASQIMPSLPNLTSAKYVAGKGKLYVSFSDDSETSDIYLFGLNPPVVGMNAEFNLTSDFSSVETSGLNYMRVILKDETIIGQDVSQVFNVYSFIDSSTVFNLDSVIVDLFNVTDDYYRFDQSFGLSESANGNPFAEPVIMHRNFENGYGVFALGKKVSWVIPVQ